MCGFCGQDTPQLQVLKTVLIQMEDTLSSCTDLTPFTSYRPEELTSRFNRLSWNIPGGGTQSPNGSLNRVNTLTLEHYG